MPVAALSERSYPGYDLENLVFDLDDPEFEDLNMKLLPRSRSICSLSIRQSKSDSLLLAYEHFYHQPQHYQDQGSYEINSGLQRNRTATFFCGADYESSSLSQSSLDSAMLTIEELRTYNKSCATCGVSWYDEHISLDCSECGGYAMSRPCPQCDGQCNNVWRRDIDGSHNTHKAKWDGVCLVSKEGQLSSNRHQIDNDVLVKALDNLSTPL